MNYRKSSYTIAVCVDEEQKQYMLIHGYTGAIDIISAELLSQIQSPSTLLDIQPATLEAFLKRGYITTKTKEEEHAYVAHIASVLYKRESMRYTDFTWVVTYNCNFRCPYCFEEKKTKDSSQTIVFTKEMVDTAYHAMALIQPNQKLRRKIITLYGGEPLLAENKEIVEYIVNKGAEYGHKFVAVTNGYDLDSFLDLLTTDKIFRIQITVDGPKHIHDQRRIHYKACNTFEKVITNIQLALNKGIEVSIRMNTDHHNINDFLELKKYFEQLQYFNYPTFQLYSAPLNDNKSINISDYNKLDFLSAKAYIETHKQQGTISSCMDYGIMDAILKSIKTKKPLALKAAFCSSQISGYVLDPLGDIYPCWEIIGQKRFLIGKYSNKKVEWDNASLQQWRFNVCHNTVCSRCPFALLCGGGCPYHTIEKNNIHCDFYKRIFKIAVNQAYDKIKANIF